MRSLYAKLLVIDILYFTQRANSFQIRTADINGILDYLQQKRYDENKSQLESEETAPEIQILKRLLGGTYPMAQSYHDDDENIALPDFTEYSAYPETELEALSKLLSQKSQETNTQLPKFNRKPPVPKNNDKGNNAHGYSKVYLVLDPRAKINNADLKGIGDIVSMLVSKGKRNTNPQSKKQKRYKGFVVMDDFLSRRRSRDSNEKFSKDSIERDYKPKRARSDYNVGAGRTAIPYIGHRGDIYERD